MRQGPSWIGPGDVHSAKMRDYQMDRADTLRDGLGFASQIGAARPWARRWRVGFMTKRTRAGHVPEEGRKETAAA